jgi:predicted permease
MPSRCDAPGLRAMSGLRVILSRVLALFWRRGARDASLNDEIQDHLDLLADEYVRRGLAIDDARAAARREFGGVEQMKERYRDQISLPGLETTLRDLRYALRTFRRRPGFVIAVVLSLSLGIGLNSAIFTVLNAVILRPLPVRNPQELFLALPQDPDVPGTSRSALQFSYPVFERLRGAAATTDALAAMSRVARMYTRVSGESRPVSVQLVSGGFFSMLGVSPSLGRVLSDADNQHVGGHPVAVISHTYWQRALLGDADVVGRGITLNGTWFTIVGVSAPGFAGVWLESPVDAWIPLVMQGDARYAQNYSNDDADPSSPFTPQEGIRWLDVVGRQAMPQVTGMAAALETAFAATVASEAERIDDAALRARRLRDRLILEPFEHGFSNLRTRFTPPLLALFGMTTLILLIACVNTVNLMLARAGAMQREVAIRLSIGASRGRLIRQLLTETAVLVAAATGIGLIVAGAAGELLVRQAIGATGSIPFAVDVNGRVLGFTVTAAVVTVLILGLAPAFRMTDLHLGTALRVSGGRSSSARPKLQKALVAAQVALSLVLLAGAGLFVRTLQNYAHVSLGFSQEQVLGVRIDSKSTGYSPARLSALYRDLVARVESIPGVSSASVAECALVVGCQNIGGVTIDGYQPAPDERVRAQVNHVSASYFATTGMRLLAGRHFDDRDRENTPKVAIVNRAMAERYFRNGMAVGGRFGYGTPDVEIVGVVEDARVNRVQEPATPMAFFPMTQESTAAGTLDVRATGDPRSIVADVRRAVVEVDGALPIAGVTLLSEQVSGNLRQERLIAGLASLFGMLALALASVGLFGVMSYAVARRTAEFGIRMALGADRRRVLASVIVESLVVVGWGAAAGVPAVFFASRFVSGLLFGVGPHDPTALSISAILLAGVAVVASFFPASRASRVDPMLALRCE